VGPNGSNVKCVIQTDYNGRKNINQVSINKIVSFKVECILWSQSLQVNNMKITFLIEICGTWIYLFTKLTNFLVINPCSEGGRTTDNSRMRFAHEWIISVVRHEWHIFGNWTSKLVILFIIDCLEPIHLIFSFIWVTNEMYIIKTKHKSSVNKYNCVFQGRVHTMVTKCTSKQKPKLVGELNSSAI
jgi:hypothetical protein